MSKYPPPRAEWLDLDIVTRATELLNELVDKTEAPTRTQEHAAAMLMVLAALGTAMKERDTARWDENAGVVPEAPVPGASQQAP